MVLFTHEGISVRTLTKDDYPNLARWLSDPRVLEFYEGRDNPHDLKKVTEVFGTKLGRQVTGCIICYQDKDIGYIQFYPITGEERTEYELTHHGIAYGLDQFIGEPDYWSRGIGTALMSAMTTYLHTHLNAELVVMDPQAWNTRAIRCYEKAGFRKAKLLPRHEWHEGQLRDCWLMVFDTNQNAQGGEGDSSVDPF